MTQILSIRAGYVPKRGLTLNQHLRKHRPSDSSHHYRAILWKMINCVGMKYPVASVKAETARFNIINGVVKCYDKMVTHEQRQHYCNFIGLSIPEAREWAEKARQRVEAAQYVESHRRELSIERSKAKVALSKAVDNWILGRESLRALKVKRRK